jgi:transposase InsO family protein
VPQACENSRTGHRYGDHHGDPQALAESFNATFKRETLQGRKRWSSEHEARLDAFRWLNRYNTRRRHIRLGQRSPIAYETALDTTSTTLAQAA